MVFSKTKMIGITKEQLVSDWSELTSITKIAAKYNTAKNNIIYYFKKWGIPYNTKIRNYGVDHFFFAKDNEETFYWAGFLAADGCISIRKNFNNQNLILKLGEKDLDHLTKFKKIIKSNHPIKERLTKNSLLNKNWTDRKCYEITIGSHQIVSDLKKFNIAPRKTKIYRFPEWLIDHPLVNHFMRGYFDGDGNIWKSVRKNCRDQYRLSVAGNREFLDIFSVVINNNLSIMNKNVSFNGAIDVLTYGGNKLTNKVGLFLYDNANIFLERKYNLWKKCNDYYN